MVIEVDDRRAGGGPRLAARRAQRVVQDDELGARGARPLPPQGALGPTGAAAGRKLSARARSAPPGKPKVQIFYNGAGPMDPRWEVAYRDALHRRVHRGPIPRAWQHAG